jgi:AcrR family transcriptional regulator
MKKRSVVVQPADVRETVERLLDAAERLFGKHGYDGVGMRALAEEAKVNLGAATYHFGSKKALYIETFMRRFRPTNIERLRLLREAEAEAHGKPLGVEKIVDCMVRPPYLLGLKHPDFHELLARNLFMPPPFLHPAIHREMAPNAEVFIRAFRRSLPKVPEDLIHLRTMFSMGALLMFSVQMGKMRPARNPKLDEGILKELVRFISAGLQSEPAVPAADRPPIPRSPNPPRA